jgi:hypothetical protein
VGVVGELWFQSRASWVETSIRSDSHQIEGLLNDKASGANKEAAAAQKKTAELEKENRLLEADLIKLQEAAKWRDFSKSQANELSALARKYMAGATPNLGIGVDSVAGNQEARRYAGQLSTALSAAFMVKIPPLIGLSGCVQCSGVRVCVEGNAHPEVVKGGMAIRNLLTHVGVKAVTFCIDPLRTSESNAITITVGMKE